MRKIAVSLTSILFLCCCDVPQRPWDSQIFLLDYAHQKCLNLKDRSGKSDLPLDKCDGRLVETVETYKLIDNTLTSCQEQLKSCQNGVK